MSTTQTTPLETRTATPPPSAPAGPGSTVDWRRLRGPVAAWSLVACAIAAVGTSLGSVVAGQLAQHATVTLAWLLALCVVGAALLDSVARTAWAGMVDRAEGQLRADLLDAALHQPLPTLTEQAVGEVLDRVDDDTHEVGTLLRQSAWQAIRT
ncbi:MAG TPA: ABC transporter transmembrane domain-containing protein, partial [Nocardioidaceae bacterium]|nr:ABC transporter transmembrane domain-containing protein [Nocardioidaceae bacterium]